MWYHIPEFKRSEYLHVHSQNKHAFFLTLEITQFNIQNPVNGNSYRRTMTIVVSSIDQISNLQVIS